MHQVTDKPDRAAGDQVAPCTDDYVNRAELILRWRRRRMEMFDRRMFSEPAWDGLLALYIDEAAGLSVTVARLARLIGAPVPTFLRWVDYIQEEGLVIRTASRGAAAPVALTDKGHCDLELYLSAIPVGSSD